MRRTPNVRLALVALALEDDVAGGFRIVERLARERPDTVAAILSGANEPGDRKRAKELGVPFLAKPFPIAAVTRLVDRALAWPIRAASTASVVATRSREWGLTRQEHRVLAWKLAGRDAEAFQADVGLAAATFRFYLKEIARKARRGVAWTELEAQLLREAIALAEA